MPNASDLRNLRRKMPDGSRITFDAFAKHYKKIHDRNGGGYPFEVTLFEECTEQPLLRKVFKNVWDRKGQTENVCEGEWAYPLAIRFATMTETFTEEEMVIEKDTSRQMSIDEHFEQEET